MTHAARYMTGFALSILLTLIPAGLLWAHMAGYGAAPAVLYAAFVACAVAQLVVQLYFFLHMGEEPRPRWRSMALYLGLFFALVLAGGTLWIMEHLTHEEQLPFTNGVVSPQNARD